MRPIHAASPRSARPSPAAARARGRRSCGVEPLEPRTLLSLPPAGPEFRVNTSTAGQQHTVMENRAVASDAAGNFVVVWESDPTFLNNGALYGQRFNAAGVRQGGEFLIAPDTNTIRPADVAMDAGGNFVVVWMDGLALYSQRFNAAAVAQGSARLIATDVGFNTNVAMDADGDYVVTWEQLPDGFIWEHRGIFAQRFDAIGAPQGGYFQANTDTSVNHFNPGVAMSAGGDFVLTWQAESPVPPGSLSQSVLQARMYSSQGNPRGDQFNLTAPQHVVSPAADVAMDAAGNAAVAWTEPSPTGPSSDVHVRRFSPAVVPLGADLLASGGTAIAIEPTIAMAANGTYVVTWMNRTQVMGQYVNAAGFKDGGEFLAYAPTTDVGWRAALSMDADGDFVVVRTDSDGSQADVFARQFSKAPPGRNSGAGRVFNDANANGISDAGEDGLPDRRVYRDANHNGQFDAGVLSVPSLTTSTPLQPVSTRRYVGNSNPAAFVGDVIADVNVTLNIQFPTDGDLTVALVSPAGHREELFTHVGGSGSNFTTTTLDDDAPLSIAQGAAPFPGSFRTQNLTLNHFDGEPITGDGYWMLEVRNDGGNFGTVLNWSLALGYAEPSAVTDPFGNYTLPLPDGASTVRQVHQPGWAQTTPANNGGQEVFAGGSQTVVGLDFGNTRTDFISGRAFLDVNADGAHDSFDPPLPGVTIYLDTDNDGVLDPGERSAVTNVAGEYLFTNIAPGIYFLREETPFGGFRQTMPPGGGAWTVPHSAGQNHINQDFGNAYAGTISGAVFNDDNGDGVNGPGEGLLGNFTVYADLNNNGQLDPDDPSTLSNSRFGYVLNGIPIEEAVTLRAIPPASVDTPWELSAQPAPVTLTFAQPSAALQNFGAFRRGSLSGFSYYDVNGNGVMDAGETGLAGWTIYLDRNGDGQPQAAEETATTDAAGRYVFAGFAPGPYAIREAPQAGWTPTAPAAGVYSGTLTSGQQLGGFDFGSRPVGAAPRVIAVYAGGSAWRDAFRSEIAGERLGSALLGFRLAGGRAQLTTLPWSGINQVSIVFSDDVVVDQEDLAVRGTNVPAYRISAFEYDRESRTATWTLGGNFANDKLLLALDGHTRSGVRGGAGDGPLLDGDWTTGAAYPSGDGRAGGDFLYRLNVLPGDSTRDARVNALDLVEIRRRLNRAPGDGVSGAGAYSVFADIDATGRVNALDLANVRQHLGQSLPAAEPEVPRAGAAAATSSLLLQTSAMRDLFGETPVLG
jgi:subtilisin-like proprotein convertase family protein